MLKSKNFHSRAYRSKRTVTLFHKTGFTLVELMIAIAVIAIVAVLASPPLVEWNANRRLMKQARDLFSYMQHAKLEAIRNNCNVVVSFSPPNSYNIFRDDGGPAGLGTPRDDSRNGDEIIIATANLPADIALLVEATQFGGTTTPGFTSRALPVAGRTGNVVFRRTGRSDRWYRVVLSPSGQLNIQSSSNSTDGVDGSWHKL